MYLQNLESQDKINEDNVETRDTEGEKAVENTSGVGTSSNDSGQSFKGKNPWKRTMLRDSYNLLTKAQNVANSVNSCVVSENEFDLFGRMVAVQFKNLPMESAIEARQYIQNYLSGLRLKHIRRQSQTSNFIYEMVENRTQPHFMSSPPASTISRNSYYSSNDDTYNDNATLSYGNLENTNTTVVTNQSNSENAFTSVVDINDVLTQAWESA